MYEFCSDTLKANLDTKRKELLTHREKGTATDFKVEDGVNQTGIYELCAVLTHKGIAADGGHYVAWVKQEDGSWVLFDDDTVSPATEEDITKLNGKGGAQWHMAYMCLYRTKKTWTK
jgi:ubiquitin carboxyl-terminal hydrolase 14